MKQTTNSTNFQCIHNNLFCTDYIIFHVFPMFSKFYESGRSPWPCVSPGQYIIATNRPGEAAVQHPMRYPCIPDAEMIRSYMRACLITWTQAALSTCVHAACMAWLASATAMWRCGFHRTRGILDAWATLFTHKHYQLPHQPVCRSSTCIHPSTELDPWPRE
jgi:hypothetical protein